MSNQTMTLRKQNMRGRPRSIATVAACSLAGLLVTGCGLGTAGGYSPTGTLAGPLEGINLEDASVRVGSKDFTEQVILGKMAVILLQSAGADVTDLTNIPGSSSVREAMLQGQLDFQWEYTGTAWITYLGNEDPLTDSREQFEAVRDADLENGMVWLDPSELDNTYGFAMSEETTQELGITTLSEVQELDESDQTFCVDPEFAARNDGFEPMLEHYDIPPVSPSRQSTMTIGAIYQATADNVCHFGEVFTTDGRILGFDLVVLEDDQNYFPRYNLAPVFGEEILGEFPQLQELFDPISDRLDNETMTRLNARVDVDGEEPSDVAWDFLEEEGYLSE